MGWFDSFRDDGRNTYYNSNRVPVWADFKQLLVIVFCCVVTAAIVIVVLGTRGKERLTTFLRAVFTLHTGIAILLTLFSKEWLVTSGKTRCPYMVGKLDDISAYVTVSVGLYSVNISLVGDMNATEDILGAIRYNEEFTFVGVHDMQQQVLEAKLYGLPDTIIYIGEYFGVDKGDLRWLRHIRMAGKFAYILLWSTFAMWWIYNIVLCFVVIYGAILMTVAGLLMLSACALYHFLQPATPLTIPFNDMYVGLEYGWCLYAALASGGVTLITGLVLIFLCKVAPVGVSKMFMIDVLESEDNNTITDNIADDASMRSFSSRISSRPSGDNLFESDTDSRRKTRRKSSLLEVPNAKSHSRNHRLRSSESDTINESRRESSDSVVLPAITVTVNTPPVYSKKSHKKSKAADAVAVVIENEYASDVPVGSTTSSSTSLSDKRSVSSFNTNSDFGSSYL